MHGRQKGIQLGARPIVHSRMHGREEQALTVGKVNVVRGIYRNAYWRL